MPLRDTIDIRAPRLDGSRLEDLITVLVGIDDTDDLYSPGTGYHARQIGRLLHEAELAALQDITRHQLFVDERIRYTSHNSALCLRMAIKPDDIDRLGDLCRHYLQANSAPGSDAGLCIVAWDAVDTGVETFGARAKVEVLDLDAARALGGAPVYLEGLTGDHGGMIGALAAVGLRRGGCDGRIGWRPGLRETTGIHTAEQLLATTGLDAIRSVSGDGMVRPADRIDVSPWPRAVLVDGQAVLLVDPGDLDDPFDWRLTSKDVLSRY